MSKKPVDQSDRSLLIERIISPNITSDTFIPSSAEGQKELPLHLPAGRQDRLNVTTVRQSKPRNFY